MQSRGPLRMGTLFLAPLRHPASAFMFSMVFWNICLNIASPFLAAHALKNLNITFAELASMDVLTAAGEHHQPALLGPHDRPHRPQARYRRSACSAPRR